MNELKKRSLVVSALLAAGTVVAPTAASAACGDAAASGVDWTGCAKIGEDLTDAVLSSSTLTGADLSTSTVTNATFTGATADGADMSGLLLVVPGGFADGDQLITLTDADFSNADFTNSNLTGAYFLRTDLSGADLTGATIASAVFVGADLTGTVFTAGADTTGTNFSYTPDPEDDTASATFDTAVSIDVLGNDENFNGVDHGRTFLPVDVSTPANGTATVNGDGSITYTPTAGFSGTDTFTYKPQSTLPATWTLPTAVGLESTGAVATVTVNVAAEGATTDTILTGEYLGTSGTDGRIARLYAAYFHRNPDTSGFAFWKAKIAAGDWTNTRASDFFSSSPEFVGIYGADLSNDAFVTLVYNNVLDRAPEQDGFDYWTGRLDGGLSRGALMLLFSDATEFRNRTQTS